VDNDIISSSIETASRVDLGSADKSLVPAKAKTHPST